MPQTNICRVNIHILSPIHVGSGHELDPFSYIVKGDNLILIDLIKWMENFSEKSELHEKMDSDDFIGLRAYIAKNFDDENAILNSVPVKSTEVLQTYKKAVLDKNSQNQALINFMTRNEITRSPYIPGSSIKGAIRTAIANRFVKIARISSKDGYKSKYNQKIFGPATKDPMKNLKVSDVDLSKYGTVVYEAKEHSFKKKIS